MTDLSAKMSEASSADSEKTAQKLAALKAILSKVNGGGKDSETSEAEQLQAQSKAYHFDPDNAFPPDVKKQLLDVLKWHDDVMRRIEKKIESIPGLSALLEEFSNALNECPSFFFFFFFLVWMLTMMG